MSVTSDFTTGFFPLVPISAKWFLLLIYSDNSHFLFSYHYFLFHCLSHKQESHRGLDLLPCCEVTHLFSEECKSDLFHMCVLTIWFLDRGGDHVLDSQFRESSFHSGQSFCRNNVWVRIFVKLYILPRVESLWHPGHIQPLKHLYPFCHDISNRKLTKNI